PIELVGVRADQRSPRRQLPADRQGPTRTEPPRRASGLPATRRTDALALDVGDGERHAVAGPTTSDPVPTATELQVGLHDDLPRLAADHAGRSATIHLKLVLGRVPVQAPLDHVVAVVAIGTRRDLVEPQIGTERQSPRAGLRDHTVVD